MPDYNSIATKVKTGLGKAGTTMTLSRTTPGTYDPAAGTYSGSTVAEYTVTGLIQTQIYISGQVGQTFFNGMLVQTDDQFVIIAADGLAITPAPGDLLTIVGVVHTVVAMLPLRPGGTNLFYRVMARR